MAEGARLRAVLVALLTAGCSTTAPEQPAEPDRKTERVPGALPDAYKHPQK